MSGPAMFMRFGYPPNALGYCGPQDAHTVAELIAGGPETVGELKHLVAAFQGAWPYLELIARETGRDPLDESVVEAYWMGNSLLDGVDPLAWGNSLDDRFRRRAGWDWEAVVAALNGGGVPHHSFHVFCIYPWVGLLRTGATDRALEVLDRCRIRWGRVVEVSGGTVIAQSRPLVWDGVSLGLGPVRAERVDAPVDPDLPRISAGDDVAMHWNYVCQKVTDRQLAQLRRNHERHLALVNGTGRRVASRIEG